VLTGPGSPRLARLHVQNQSTARLRQVTVVEEERPLSLYREDDPTNPSASTPPASVELPGQDRDWLTRRGDLPLGSETSQAHTTPLQLNQPFPTSFAAPVPTVTLQEPASPFQAAEAQQTYVNDRTYLAPLPDLPATGPIQSSSSAAPSTRIQRLNPGIGILSSRDPPIDELPGSSGLPIVIAHRPAPTTAPENNPPQNQASNVEMDEDERALAQAIERSLRQQNRYTVGGTNLEELQTALVTSLYEQ
jgi:hypothetical protein